MNDDSTHIFNIFRYQILPLEQSPQLSLFSDNISLEDLKKQKNNYFAEALGSLKKFEYSRSEIAHKVIYHSSDFSILKIGHQKILKITDKNFDQKPVDDWTPISVLINNKPEIQKIFIEKNTKVFANTNTVASFLERNLSHFLKKFHLGIFIEPMFGKEDFWEIINRYPKSLTRLTFNLVSPNLANISGALKLDLPKLNEETNTNKTKLELNSPKTSYLTIKPENEMIESLLDYSSEGGGEVTMKVKGIRKNITMSESVQETEIDEIELSISDIDKAIPILKEIVS